MGEKYFNFQTAITLEKACYKANLTYFPSLEIFNQKRILLINCLTSLFLGFII